MVEMWPAGWDSWPMVLYFDWPECGERQERHKKDDSNLQHYSLKLLVLKPNRTKCYKFSKAKNGTNITSSKLQADD